MHKAIQTYLDSIQTLCPSVAKAELDFLERGLSISELKSKHFYIHANTIQKELGFVYSGLLRTYYIEQNGNDITVNFIKEHQFATHYSALTARQPSKYYFQCLEPSVLVNLSYKHIQEAYLHFPALERYGRLIAEAVLRAQQKRIESFLFDTAEKRYLDFINENPDLFNRVSLSYLSTFLGIERPSLSRIRKKLTQK